MQYDPTKVGLNYQGNIYANQYPVVNQSQFVTGNNYQSYQAPPPYSPYPSQPIGGAGYAAPSVQSYGQTPLYPQQTVIIVPTYRSFWRNQILTKITPNIRAFCIISGIIYTIWSLAIISLDVAVAIESYWTFYRSFWAGGFILAGGICILIVACRTSYSLINLLRMFVLPLFFCVLGLILSAINYSTSDKCSSWPASKFSCDTELVSNLKMTNLIVFIVATIHTLINILVFSNEHRKTSLKSAVPNH